MEGENVTERERITKDFEIELAIQAIIPMIKKKVKEYSKTRDKRVEKELADLLKDREKIYSQDLEIIKKYIIWG